MSTYDTSKLWGSGPVKVGFGTNRLGSLTRKEREQLLGNVWDLGVRHFDTAPLYGSGDAEEWLGEFLHKGREDATVLTKYGLTSSVAPGSPRIRNLARQVRRCAGPLAGIGIAALRKLRSGKHQALSSPNLDSSEMSASLVRSVDSSLSKLRRDRIDILALHEPTVAIMMNPDFIETLVNLKRQGKVAAIGAAGYFPYILPLAQQASGIFDVYQFDCDPELKNLDVWNEGGFPNPIVFGSIAGALPEGLPNLSPVEKLKRLVAANPLGLALFSTTKIQHAKEVLRSL
jgi:D-threo-aldose 1-dehydrogenase